MSPLEFPYKDRNLLEEDIYLAVVFPIRYKDTMAEVLFQSKYKKLRKKMQYPA